MPLPSLLRRRPFRAFCRLASPPLFSSSRYASFFFFTSNLALFSSPYPLGPTHLPLSSFFNLTFYAFVSHSPPVAPFLFYLFNLFLCFSYPSVFFVHYCSLPFFYFFRFFARVRVFSQSFLSDINGLYIGGNL